MITKQAIRKGVEVQCNGKTLTKEQIISKGENWSEQTENFFRKMLKQGGEFKVNGNKFRVTVAERTDIDSAGNKPVTVPPLPGERTF
jgi:hypothetical protein